MSNGNEVHDARCQHCDGLVTWAHRTEKGYGGFVHDASGISDCDPYDYTAGLFAEADDLPTLNEHTGGGCMALVTECRTGTIVVTNLDSDTEWLVGFYPGDAWRECGEGVDYIDTDARPAELVELVRFFYQLDMHGAEVTR